MKLGNFLSRTIRCRYMVYGTRRDEQSAGASISEETETLRVYTVGWSFNKMELIFISYTNNDRNKVGSLAISLMGRRCRRGNTVSVFDLPVQSCINRDV